MLGCPIVQVQILRKGPRSSFKVKIAKDYLLTALLSTEGKDHRARLWKNRSRLATYPVTPITTSQESAAKEPVSLTISSWNYRGLKFSAPYLQVLSNMSDIILLQEHWLWPFELHSLSSVLCGFSSHGSCDNESSDLQRGCGGVGILWKESIAAHPIHLNTDCDRICAIALPLENHRVNKLIVLNVYFLPSTVSDPTTFMQCTLELEAILNRYSEEGGAVVIAGDFNAHLGTLAGPRGTGPPNQRGFIVKDLIDRNNLFVASRSHSSTGPPFTYHSGGTLSTIDYIIINRTASDILCSCEGLCDHSLNVLDHLPLSITLQVSYSPIENLSSAARINWERAITTDSIHAYAVTTSPHCWIPLVMISPNWIMKFVVCAKPRAGLPPSPYPVSQTLRKKHVTSTMIKN